LLNQEKSKTELEGYEKEYTFMKSGYDAKYIEVYNHMSAVVKGETQPDIKSTEKELYAITDSTETTEVGVPLYWGTAIKNSKYYPTNEKDDEILKHLIDIRLTYLDKFNYKIDFEFKPNEFFTDVILTKTFIFDEKTEEIEKSTGTNVHWASADKNPKIKITTKKIKKGKKVETKKN